MTRLARLSPLSRATAAVSRALKTWRDSRPLLRDILPLPTRVLSTRLLLKHSSKPSTHARCREWTLAQRPLCAEKQNNVDDPPLMRHMEPGTELPCNRNASSQPQQRGWRGMFDTGRRALVQRYMRARQRAVHHALHTVFMHLYTNGWTVRCRLASNFKSSFSFFNLLQQNWRYFFLRKLHKTCSSMYTLDRLVESSAHHSLPQHLNLVVTGSRKARPKKDTYSTMGTVHSRAATRTVQWLLP